MDAVIDKFKSLRLKNCAQNLPDVLEHPIDGRDIKEGDVIVLLQSRGFRSNGYSLVRRIMENTFGEEWHNASYDEKITWGEKLLTPSIVYCKAVNHLIENGIIPSGIAHITGGGLADNIARALKDNKLGAKLDNIFPPADFVKKVQELGDVKEEQAYRIWNMGNGMAIILDEALADKAVEMINSNDLGLAYKAKKAGVTIAQQTIIIHSKGCNAGVLEYSAEI